MLMSIVLILSIVPDIGSASLFRTLKSGKRANDLLEVKKLEIKEKAVALIPKEKDSWKKKLEKRFEKYFKALKENLENAEDNIFGLERELLSVDLRLGVGFGSFVSLRCFEERKINDSLCKLAEFIETLLNYGEYFILHYFFLDRQEMKNIERQKEMLFQRFQVPTAVLIHYKQLIDQRLDQLRVLFNETFDPSFLFCLSGLVKAMINQSSDTLSGDTGFGELKVPGAILETVEEIHIKIIVYLESRNSLIETYQDAKKAWVKMMNTAPGECTLDRDSALHALRAAVYSTWDEMLEAEETIVLLGREIDARLVREYHNVRMAYEKSLFDLLETGELPQEIEDEIFRYDKDIIQNSEEILRFLHPEPSSNETASPGKESSATLELETEEEKH